ncbi:acyl-CoA synthetase, putative [Plasmodium sp. gorilla clade G2]|uniref:acyl-CoA synthetase, putative n=1 Tax=Plasmodium sp. gorilla clade G2 TaxID=880535 RepID=UPI000D2E5006|nr:acyl-CoA synthetase, putative [Plasmodium sp. gorilla clade G2]XP_028541316.1 acyl-CoA synthetase, putative [Plasmodium sp. gorilla clade G2]SOV20149.1 acyl-CoA synthetase, putative [Plasmodium sp. gorilla clade G2]SOV20258.1 acyl-CoA synthetase, putative [Plasmodium sp. gorilla clade G2]
MSIIYTAYIFIIYLICVLPCINELFRRNRCYSEICERSKDKNESSVYCMKDYKEKSPLFVYKHIMKLFAEQYTLKGEKIGLVEHSCGEPENYVTYNNFFKKVLSFSHALNTYEGKGIEEKIYNEKENGGKFRLLGLYGSNSINWLATDLGAMISGVTTLVIHSKFSLDVIVNILNETKIEWLCLDLDLVEGILNRKNELPYLKKLIILDSLVKYNKKNLNVGKHVDLDNNNNNKRKKKEIELYKEEKKDINLYSLKYDNEKLEKIKSLKENWNKIGIDIITFDDITKVKSTNFNIKNEDPDFVTSIVYTSGTSGKPKGVMLSNKNFYNAVISIYYHDVVKNYNFEQHLSYLPVSHIYERIYIYLIFMNGGMINIWSKDMKFFSKDIRNSEDEIIAGVPKVFSRMYTNIITEINNLSSCKRNIVKSILYLRKLFKNGCFSNFLERITNISSKLRNKINPNMKVILNGGGKLSAKIADELRVLLNIKYYQGYGLTEGTGPIFAQSMYDDNSEGMGGPICPSTKYKVRTWETYKATDRLPKGELLIKSDSIFRGYFLEKESTKNSFTKDGYFKTGDVVQINDNGSVTFLDRSKGLVKLSQGEYIETDLLNNLYSQICFINNCVVYGDDSMDGPLAIISVDKGLFFKSLKNDNMLEKTGIDEKNYLEKLTDENINHNIYVDYVKNKMMDIFKKTNLNRYNIINDIYLTSKTWDTTNYFTPSLKIKRFNVFKDFSFYIDEVKKKYEDKLKGSNLDNKNKEKKEDEKKNDQKKEENDSKKLEKASVSEPHQTIVGIHQGLENKKVKLRAVNGTRELSKNK